MVRGRGKLRGANCFRAEPGHRSGFSPYSAVADELRLYFNDELRRYSKHAVFIAVRGQAMKCSKRAFAIVSLLFAVLLPPSIGTLNARDADFASRSFAAAPTAKQQCINTCRARYRDCRRLNQLPKSECRDVYQDCTRYTCTGLGPG